MSILDLLTSVSHYPILVIAAEVAIPLLALILRLIHGPYDGPLPPWKYFYTILIYLASVPGVLVLFFVLYRSVFLHENLLALSIVTYYLPPLSCAAALIIIRKSVSFREIPGFRTLEGLFLLITISFLGLLLLDRLRVFLFFRGSILGFALIWLAIFIVLRVVVRLMFGKFRH